MKSNIQWVTEQLAEIRTRLNRLERLRREEAKAASFRDDVDSFLATSPRPTSCRRTYAGRARNFTPASISLDCDAILDVGWTPVRPSWTVPVYRASKVVQKGLSDGLLPSKRARGQLVQRRFRVCPPA